jgi:hypothetical protein
MCAQEVFWILDSMIQSYGLEDLYKPDFPGLKKVQPPPHNTAGGGAAIRNDDVGRKNDELRRDSPGVGGGVKRQMFFLQDQLMRCFLPNLHDHFHRQSIRTSSYITKVDPFTCAEREREKREKREGELAES